MVWPLGHCPLHPVSHSPSHFTRRLLVDTDRALANKNESSLRVYSTGDLPDVYEDTFMSVAKPDGRTFHPTLILVCTRLGIDKINQVYMESLTATLQMEQSIGIAGYVPYTWNPQTYCFRLTTSQWPTFFIPLLCWCTGPVALLLGPPPS